MRAPAPAKINLALVAGPLRHDGKHELLTVYQRVGLPQNFARIKKVVAAGFAHRRKTLPNSLELAGLASRAEAVDALATIGRESATRAEALTPQELVAFTAALQ
jgi:4-diphosphocytidyl-2C-methyl-D-erythritol kinase